MDIKSNYEKLILLKEPRYRKAMIQCADKQLIGTLCTLIYRVLKNDINISESDKQKLRRYQTVLRKLCQKSSLKTKKSILTQQGGFLEFLIPSIIGGLATVVGDAVSAAINSGSSSDSQE